MTRPQTAANPRVPDGSKTYEKIIDVEKPEIKQPIIEVDILSEHTKFLNQILSNKLPFKV